jgi:hypothetical protein
MSLPNAVYLRQEKNEMENAQFNTTLCKGKMNFTWQRKKWRDTAGAAPATMPGFFGGRARAKTDLLYHNAGQVNKKGGRLSVSRTGGDFVTWQ